MKKLLLTIINIAVWATSLFAQVVDGFDHSKYWHYSYKLQTILGYM